MKRFFAMILTLCLLASMVVLPVSAANSPEDIRLMQDAVVETALSYFRAGTNIHYDWNAMTVQDRLYYGVSRVTSEIGLGAVAPDNPLYTNCAQFVYSLYRDTFGYAAAGANNRTAYVRCYMEDMAADHPELVLRRGGDGMQDAAAFQKKMKEVLQPGDIVMVMQTSTYTNHAMVYAGDLEGDGGHWVIHSSGSPSGHMGPSTAATMKKVTWDLFLEGGPYSVVGPKYDAVLVIRPINVLTPADLTPAARARLNYPGLDVMREADVLPYMDVLPGQEVQVKLTLTNSSQQDMKGITVTDPAPAGAEAAASSVTENGAAKDGGVSWTVDLPAGKTAVLSYRVKVTAQKGETVTVPLSHVAGIPTRELKWTVGGTPVDKTKVTAVLTAQTVEGITPGMGPLEFANAFYRSVLGTELDLPTDPQILVDGLLTAQTVRYKPDIAAKMLQPKAYEELDRQMKTIRSMIIPDHLRGRMVHLGNTEEDMLPRDRVVTYFADAYRPGDIFIAVTGSAGSVRADVKKTTVWICLGDGYVCTPTSDGTGIALDKFSRTVEQTLEHNIVMGLRPSLMTVPAEEAPAVPGTTKAPEAPGGTGLSGDMIGILIGAAAILAAVVLLVVKKKSPR